MEHFVSYIQLQAVAPNLHNCHSIATSVRPSGKAHQGRRMIGLYRVDDSELGMTIASNARSQVFAPCDSMVPVLRYMPISKTFFHRGPVSAVVKE